MAALSLYYDGASCHLIKCVDAMIKILYSFALEAARTLVAWLVVNLAPPTRCHHVNWDIFIE